MLETPYSNCNYNMAWKSGCEGLKIQLIGQSAAKHPVKDEGSETIPEGSTAKKFVGNGRRLVYCVLKRMRQLVRIYVLKHPLTFEVRYVGATSQSLRRRLSGHIWDAKNLKGTRKINWINSLLKEHLCPIIELVETCENWQEREKFWYDFYSKENVLVNTRDGGAGVFKKDRDSIGRSSQAKFKAIVQFSLEGKLLQEWPSIRDATLALKLSRNSIKNCLRGSCSSSGGFRWRYKGEKNFASVRNPEPRKPVSLICIDGRVLKFRSVATCAKHLNVSVYTIHKLLQDGILREDIVRSSRKLEVNKSGRT